MSEKQHTPAVNETERWIWQKAMSLISDTENRQQIIELVFKQLKQVSEQQREIERYSEELKHMTERRNHWKNLAEQRSEQAQRIHFLMNENKELKDKLRKFIVED